MTKKEKKYKILENLFHSYLNKKVTKDEHVIHDDSGYDLGISYFFRDEFEQDQYLMLILTTNGGDDEKANILLNDVGMKIFLKLFLNIFLNEYRGVVEVFGKNRALMENGKAQEMIKKWYGPERVDKMSKTP